MKRLRGSFSDKNQPIITLRDVVYPSEGGTIKVHEPNLIVADPIPNSWVMLKNGDMFVSKSGTIRMLLRKNWEVARADCLRFKCENHGEKLDAVMDLEKTNIDSSNFQNLIFVVRDTQRGSQVDFTPDLFTKTVRFNVLSLLGFGHVGTKLHELLSRLINNPETTETAFAIQCDAATGRFESVVDIQDTGEAEIALVNSLKLPIAIHWIREQTRGLFRISEFDYPEGTNPVIMETITLSCEIANSLSYSSDILAELSSHG